MHRLFMQSKTQIMTPVLAAGSLVLVVSFAIRAAFGVFQIPIAQDYGWARSEFSLAIALQNLFWGIGQPLFGALAERIGDRRAIVVGAGFYAFGLALSAFATTPLTMQGLEVLVGFGIAGTGFGMILAVIGRATSEENRSMALGAATAIGSAGQVLGAPLAEWPMTLMSWQSVFLVFAGLILGILVVLPAMRAPEASTAHYESMGRAVARALRDPSFALIFIGFFSCGYQLGFITAHFPALVTEMCSPVVSGSALASLGISSTSVLGAAAISIVGLFNIGGTLAAGWLGKRHSKKLLLASIYTARTLISAAFILSPITPATVVVFSAAMGSLWLATVPLTSGLVAHIYGPRYMGTLYGIVFLSHQIGSFVGAWLGGRLYDLTDGYTAVWWVGVAVGALSALVHLPISERRIAKPAA